MKRARASPFTRSACSWPVRRGTSWNSCRRRVAFPRYRERFPQGFLQTSSGAGPTSAAPRRSSTAPPRRSAWQRHSFPQFSLTGGASWQSTISNTWFRGASRSLFAGPAATWPIFQGGAIVSNIHAQEALRDQAFVTYQQTVLTALQDVENALVAFAKEQEHNKSLGMRSPPTGRPWTFP